MLALGKPLSGDIACRIFALVLARLAELALLQAGNCADAAQFSLAGDLLINPRQVEVYVRGRPRPLVRPRHRCLSDILGLTDSPGHRAAWLASHTYPVIRRQALLPELRVLMADCGLFGEEYLSDLSRRMTRVAETLSFLAAWQIFDDRELCRRLAQAGEGEREMLESAMCRFEPAVFCVLGGEIRRLKGGMHADHPTVHETVAVAVAACAGQQKNFLADVSTLT